MAKKTQAAQYLELGTVVNITGAEVTFFISGSAGQLPVRYVLPPGGTAQIQPGYCQPRPTSNPAIFLPPIIVNRTVGKVVPVDSEEGQAYLASREAAKAKPEAKPEPKAEAPKQEAKPEPDDRWTPTAPDSKPERPGKR